MKINMDYLNIRNYKKLYRNIPAAQLIEIAVKNGEGQLSDKGAFVVNTGKYTGRSPKDRFIVKDNITQNKINWGKINLPIEERVFDKIYKDMTEYLEGKDLFVFDGCVGALKKYNLPIRVVCEYAYQALFANQMFIRLDDISNHVPEFNVISAPGFKAKGAADGLNSEAFVLINFSKRIVLIGGTAYSGEIKKSMFSIMNFLLPQKGVLPMHCSANKGNNGDTVIFFGLSGTGKTTLSTDSSRKLIGDDEHGWCSDGIFNFEGGCYAKAIRLNKDKEREIYNAIKFGTVLENVVLDEKKVPDYDDGAFTENTRAAYPLDYIENVDLKGTGNSPTKIIFLTADAFGIMPPVSKLTKEQAMYYFMSGYTSKVAGTERGITEPKTAFSACFGEPFMLLNPEVYAKLLGQKIDKHDAEVYLVNTGWIGGDYNKGKRINLTYTRAMVKAIISDGFKDVEFYEHPMFKVLIPEKCEGVPQSILNPRDMWDDKIQYDEQARKLCEEFKNNFKKFKGISKDIVEAEPCENIKF
ncbi:MAG: phosphoenolpyruvate carboxykinase (ATP) [Clostridium sp.]|nr:phosphoenolpyruvate carboxykinase (ATP) [Clostridium sp.]